MRFIGRVFKREKYVDRKGVPKEKLCLIDETPDGESSVAFIEIPGDSTEAKKDEFVEFKGRIASSNGTKSFVFPDVGTVKIVG